VHGRRSSPAPFFEFVELRVLAAMCKYVFIIIMLVY
jgi:hypothetical protein